MELQIMYRKEYSALADLQEPRSAQYILTTDKVEEQVLYGIQITEIGPSGIENGTYFPLTDSRSEAERILTYLYENAVACAHCEGVVGDLKAMLNIAGRERYGTAKSHPALDCG